VNSSISRRLVLWLAVPLTLLALCGALVHYFYSVAPTVLSSDRRMKEATASVLANLQIKDGGIPQGARARIGAGTDASNAEARGAAAPGGAAQGAPAPGTNPSGKDAPAGNASGTNALGTNASATNPSGINPTGINPAGTDATGANATATNAPRADTSAATDPGAAEPGAAAPPPLPSADSVIYAVRDGAGRLLAGDARLPAVALSGAPSQLAAMTQLDRRKVRSLTTRLDTPSGVMSITVADVRPAAEPAARLGLMNTLLWDFVQLDLTLVLVWVGIRLGLRPVRRLREDIAARSARDLRAIDLSSAPRELAPVVVTLNRLFDSLRAAVQAQQQFIANTAHQLRTPLTGMQAQLDLLIAEPAAQPVRHRLATLQEGIRQLAHSTNQLLALARADPALNIAPKKYPIDLKAIVGDVVARSFDRALRSHIDLGIDAQPVSVIADPSLLDDLVSNLVDNAVKYTPAGGRVTVSVGRLDGRPYLAVEDTGPGIPAEERHRVRQRFYRMPNSPGHGSGLGLAIVDEIARIHDATVEIGPGADGIGTRVLLRLA
jgi:two-component system sensor histidine kinase TctE